MDQPITSERVALALRSRLGLDSGGMDAAECQDIWAKLQQDKRIGAIVDQVASSLGSLMADAVRSRLAIGDSADGELAQSLWAAMKEWASAGSRMPKVAGRVTDAVKRAIKHSPAASIPKSEFPSPHNGKGQNVTPPAPPPAANWKYLPIPESPKPAEEFIAMPFQNPPTGFLGFGARVRGKKHKHDGTNCDDWFAFDQTADGWTVIAVADGAGSKKLSRIGAKVATGAALGVLREMPGFSYPSKLEDIQLHIVGAMQKAFKAVQNEAVVCANDPDLTQHLGNRVAEIGDLSCTLLLAAMREVEVDGKKLQLVIACQVGDGMVGAIHRDGRPFLIGSADSGAHAGETEFITSAGKTESEYLNRKLDTKIIDLQALLVMTDGVADDYFPADPHLARLWGDLVVNGIPSLNAPPSADGATGAPVAAEDGTESEVIEPDPRTKVTLYSSAKIAERLGTTAEELVKRPADLWAGRRPLAGATPEERLRLWLDAYHVRGSFDDRTLVCIHREDLQ